LLDLSTLVLLSDLFESFSRQPPTPLRLHSAYAPSPHRPRSAPNPRRFVLLHTESAPLRAAPHRIRAASYCSAPNPPGFVLLRSGGPSTKAAGLYRFASPQLYWNLSCTAVYRVIECYLYSVSSNAKTDTHPRACPHVWSLRYRQITTSHALGSFSNASAPRISQILTRSFAKYRADVRLQTSVKTSGGSTDFIDSGSFSTLNDSFITRPFAISSRQAWAVAMLLRIKTVGLFKSATCPITSCAICVLMSGQ
jgi:hypothetical protein